MSVESCFAHLADLHVLTRVCPSSIDKILISASVCPFTLEKRECFVHTHEKSRLDQVETIWCVVGFWLHSGRQEPVPPHPLEHKKYYLKVRARFSIRQKVFKFSFSENTNDRRRETNFGLSQKTKNIRRFRYQT